MKNSFTLIVMSILLFGKGYSQVETIKNTQSEFEVFCNEKLIHLDSLYSWNSKDDENYLLKTEIDEAIRSISDTSFTTDKLLIGNSSFSELCTVKYAEKKITYNNNYEVLIHTEEILFNDAVIARKIIVTRSLSGVYEKDSIRVNFLKRAGFSNDNRNCNFITNKVNSDEIIISYANNFVATIYSASGEKILKVESFNNLLNLNFTDKGISKGIYYLFLTDLNNHQNCSGKIINI